MKDILFPIPTHVSKNFTKIDMEGLGFIEGSIKKNYHTGWRSESNYSKENYKADLRAHLYERLESDRGTIVPWIDNATNLKRMRILEIGCGTGSSSIALAEQGARVTGIDIDEGALIVAKDRSDVYNVDAEFKLLNAQQISGVFNDGEFDVIIFFACLEHMTIAERLSSLRDAWEILPTNGLLVIVETPNRLWYFDDHSSMLPFFHWLPNELAFWYTKFSSRENFRELYNEDNEVSKEHFIRRGRGVSFHEVDIAIGPVDHLKVISSLSTFQGLGYRLKESRMARQYKTILRRLSPNIHEGFFDNYLDLIIQKKS
ncbi:MAG: class I SAM-dependent methyltransferase [Marinilabilia sp.]